MTQRKLLRVAALASLLVTACIDPDGTDDLEVGTSTHAIAGDPSTVVEYGWCYYKYSWNGTAARVYHPANGGCSSPVYSPLVVVMPGNGYGINLYHYLGRHLAKNGFIVAIVDPVAASAGGFNPPGPAQYQAAADEAWDFVTDFLWATWSKRFYINPNAVALIGHSRGGEAVRYLADSLAADPIFDVKAVVSIAGSDHTGNFLGAGDAIAALYLHGNKDGDIDLAKGIRAYDRTGADVSQNDPAANPAVLYRTFKLFVGGDHPNFTSKKEAANGDKPDQRAATQGYVLAFLKAHLADDFVYYNDYIRGDAVPGPWSAGMYTQTADGYYSRVIDNFENGFLGINALGDFLLVGPNTTAAIENTGLDALVAHDTRVLAATATSDGWIQWNLPAGKRNAQVFRMLSVRLGRRASTGNGGVTVQLLNNATWSSPIELADWGSIAEEVTTCVADNSPECFAPAPSLAHMSTVRVPLSELGLHNDVRAVRLNIVGDAIADELLIDSLSFSEFIFGP